ncbi:hypothetical protein WG66_000199, partial [Moniliophthora roreri]
MKAWTSFKLSQAMWRSVYNGSKDLTEAATVTTQYNHNLTRRILNTGFQYLLGKRVSFGQFPALP